MPIRYHFRSTMSTNRTQTIRLTTTVNTSNKQSQRITPQKSNQSRNASSMTPGASTEIASFIPTKDSNHNKEPTIHSVKESVPVVPCNCTSNTQETQPLIIPKIELSDENKEMTQETTSLLNSSMTTEASSDVLKTSIDEGDTIKFQENHQTNGKNNILRIDTNDLVAMNDIKTRTTAVVWL